MRVRFPLLLLCVAGACAGPLDPTDGGARRDSGAGPLDSGRSDSGTGDSGGGFVAQTMDFDMFARGPLAADAYPFATIRTDVGAPSVFPYADAMRLAVSTMPNMLCLTTNDTCGRPTDPLVVEFARPVRALRFDIVGFDSSRLARVVITGAGQTASREILSSSVEMAGGPPLAVDLSDIGFLIDRIRIEDITDAAGFAVDSFRFEIASP